MLGDWASYLIYLLVAAAIAGTLLSGSFVWSRFFHRSLRPGKQKSRSFESGVSAGGFQPSNFSVNYYLTAMLFIVFDIEIVFLYPWAVAFDRLELFGLIEMVLFIVTVLVVYAYVWRRRGLEWD